MTDDRDYDDMFEDPDDPENYDDVDVYFEELYENEQFAQDDDFHNMAYDSDMDCWSSYGGEW